MITHWLIVFVFTIHGLEPRAFVMPSPMSCEMTAANVRADLAAAGNRAVVRCISTREA